MPGGVNSPGARVRVGRRDAVLREDGEGRRDRRRRRQPLRRLRHVVGPAPLRPRAEGGPRGGPQGARRAARPSARPAAPRSSSPSACRALVPSMEKVRFVSSGTEAAMSAVRLARAATGRDLVLKFAGCYHGHADSFLVAAGSGVATLGIPGSPGRAGRPREGDAHGALQRPRRGRGAVRGAPGQDRRHRRRAGRREHGRRPPEPGFLEGLRTLADRERRAPHLRRGDHRLPRRPRRRAGDLRRPARPHLPRQDHRRRPPGRRLRRPRRPDGARSRPTAPSTRRARSRGTRSPWRRASPMLDSLTPAVYAKLEKTAAKLEKGMRKVAKDLGVDGPPHAEPDRLDPDPLLQRAARSRTSTT